MVASITIKTDPILKREATTLFDELGLNMTTALNLFILQAVREHRIPFEITSDPFYSPSNMAHLERGIHALNNGLGHEHEIIEE